MVGGVKRVLRVKQEKFERARMPADHNRSAGKRCHVAMQLPTPVATGAMTMGYGRSSESQHGRVHCMDIIRML